MFNRNPIITDTPDSETNVDNETEDTFELLEDENMEILDLDNIDIEETEIIEQSDEPSSIKNNEEQIIYILQNEATSELSDLQIQECMSKPLKYVKIVKP